VRAGLKEACATLQSREVSAEIAFFGGSFTAVAPDYRRALLAVAGEFLREGIFTGIRVSTRPDAIDCEVLSELEGVGVTAIELGAQSMDDQVLSLAGRGHTADHTVKAAGMIRGHGFSLGLQMMTGLPGDTREKAIETARRLADLKPDTVRIYPTLVLEGSGLGREYAAGRYQPQTLEEATGLCATLLRFFTGEGIKVIRLGLAQESGLAAKLIIGPHHPAFRELVEGQILLEEVRKAIQEGQIPSGPIEIEVSPGSISKMAGQNRRNIEALEQMGYIPKISPSETMGYLQVSARHR